MKRLLASLCLSSATFLAGCASAPETTTNGHGDVRAVTRSGVLVGASENGVSVFKGVPYAQPPVGELRWAPPRPVSWRGEKMATEFGAPCLQRTPPDGAPNGGGVSGPSSEDCLYLNVWAPAGVRKAPVMVWLYGGGGTMGSGHVPTYQGDAFARDGVVLVTINYRHGALAGFAHPALTASVKPGEAFANYHLLDAIAALQWVKANAPAFGGDPANVTLFGESAGATMVANLVTSPMAKGLFQKAIIQSTGSLPTPATPLARAEERGVELATAMGLPGAEATVEQLRGLNADNILANRQLGGGLRTILDGRVKPQSILDSFASGAEIDIPMIIGTNSDEGRLSGTQKVAEFAMSGAPVWQYFFDYVPQVRRADNPNGAPHAAEIPFVFDTLNADRRTAGRVTDEDQRVADYVHGCWVAFAKQTVASREISCADGFRWPARTSANSRAVAVFRNAPSLGNAVDLRSPPNGAKPGPTSRDED